MLESSAGNVWRTVRIFYAAPDGTFLQNVEREFFFYTHPNHTKVGPHDLAVGATATSLGLANHHFARLYRGSGIYQGPVTFAAPTKTLRANALHYGGGAIHQWHSVNNWQGICAGDSGAPGFEAPACSQCRRAGSPFDDMPLLSENRLECFRCDGLDQMFVETRCH